MSYKGKCRQKNEFKCFMKVRNKSAERLFVVTKNETANCRERIVICNRKISKFDMNIRPNSRL